MPVTKEELEGGNILRVRVTGKLTSQDYLEFAPDFERLVRQHGKLRLLVELRDFHGWDAGALWQDVKFDLKHFNDIERVAILGETKAHERMAAFCRHFTRAEVRYFDSTPEQAEAARQWLAPRFTHAMAVALFLSHSAAEAAVKAFNKAGFDLRNFSIIAQDYHSEEHVLGYYNTGDRMKSWGKLGVLLGGIWGLFLGAAVFFIPGLGPIIVAGPAVASLVGALEGAALVGGFTALGAALYGMGIPKNSILRYETELKAGKFLLLIQGTEEEIQRAQDKILNDFAAEEVALHKNPNATGDSLVTPSGPMTESTALAVTGAG